MKNQAPDEVAYGAGCVAVCGWPAGRRQRWRHD